jgi:hypothetical protein
MGMIGNNDDQCVVPLGRKAFGDRYRIVEHDRVIDRALPAVTAA